MTAKSYFIEFKGNKFPNSPKSGGGRVCAVRKISTGKWLKKVAKKDLDNENVICVCFNNCKKCDFSPGEKSCNGGNMAVAMTYGAELTIQVSGSDIFV